MIKIIEEDDYSGVQYSKFIIENGLTCKIKDIKFLSNILEYKKLHYYLLYNTDMKLMHEVFEFINIERASGSENTRIKDLYALKLLYSFSELFECNPINLNKDEINKLKWFLRGVSPKSSNISMDLLSYRSSHTINEYLSIYRSFYSFLGNDNSYFHKTKGFKNISINAANGQEIKVSKYVSDEKVPSRPKIVPMYIKISQMNIILDLIEKEYSIREEIIVRLMFECGLRLGEVLGLTWEDICLDYHKSDSIGKIYIRNRLSDKQYQCAKTCYKPKDSKEYSYSEYQQLQTGYQFVQPSTELIKKIDEYIMSINKNLKSKAMENFLKYSIADMVTDGSSLETSNNYYLFINNQGKPLSKSGWNKTLREIFLKCNIPIDIKTRKHNLSHRFRHGFGMFLAQYKKLDKYLLKDAMRHSSSSSVEKYINPDEEDIARVGNEICKTMYDFIKKPKIDWNKQ